MNHAEDTPERAGAHKEKDRLLDVAYRTVETLLQSYYTLTVSHAERLDPLKGKGFILLPNHQSQQDIPLEGILLKQHLNRYAYYIMMGTLRFAKIYERFRGISITQGYSVRQQAQDRKARKDALQQARAQAKGVEDTMLRLLARQEILVVHIQGGRYYKQPFTVNKPNLKRLLDLQPRLGRPIPFVPLTLYYEANLFPLSPVHLDVGTPLEVRDGDLDTLATRLHQEITGAYAQAENSVKPPWLRS